MSVRGRSARRPRRFGNVEAADAVSRQPSQEEGLFSPLGSFGVAREPRSTADNSRKCSVNTFHAHSKFGNKVR